MRLLSSSSVAVAQSLDFVAVTVFVAIAVSFAFTARFVGTVVRCFWSTSSNHHHHRLASKRWICPCCGMQQDYSQSAQWLRLISGAEKCQTKKLLWVWDSLESWLKRENSDNRLESSLTWCWLRHLELPAGLIWKPPSLRYPRNFWLLPPQERRLNFLLPDFVRHVFLLATLILPSSHLNLWVHFFLQVFMRTTSPEEQLWL